MPARHRPPRNPAVSVLIPVYNAQRYVGQAIRSILEQAFTDFECIVINDGSSDGSRAIIQRIVESDRRVVYVDQDNAGIVETLNRGMAMARAPLIARMDADDIALPDRLALQYQSFATRPDLAALGGHVRIIDADGRPAGISYAPIGRRAVTRVARLHSPLTHPAVMMRKSLVERAGGYRARYETAEDYDLWLRLLDAGHSLDNLNRILLQYRLNAGGISVSRRKRQALCTLLARSASRLRRQGQTDAMLDPALQTLDPETLRTLPARIRPCDASILEAVHGPAHTLDADSLRRLLAEARSIESDVACRREMASLKLRCSAALTMRCGAADGLAALREALAADPAVILKQPLISATARLARTGLRLRYAAGRLIRYLSGARNGTAATRLDD